MQRDSGKVCAAVLSGRLQAAERMRKRASEVATFAVMEQSNN